MVCELRRMQKSPECRNLGGLYSLESIVDPSGDGFCSLQIEVEADRFFDVQVGFGLRVAGGGAAR